jgi:hypothetical protein
MKISHLIGIILLFFLLAGSCDTTSSSVDKNDPPPTVNETCKSAALAVNQAKPFEKVEVSGISNLTEDYYVEYESASGATGLTPLLIESGKAVMIVPPNPDALMDGGELTFTVTDGNMACGELTLTVAATEPAIGNPVVDLRSSVDELTNALAEQFNLDPATIANTTLDALTPQAIPIALLIEAVENFDPVVTLADMTEDESAFTNAIIEKTGMADLLNEITTSINATNAANISVTGWQPSLMKSVENEILNSCSDLGSVPVDQFGLGDPQTLSDYIKAARGAQDNAGPFSESISTIGTAFAVVGLAAPSVGTIAGWVTYTASLVQQMRANLYPSSISNFEYQLQHTQIEEDWDTEKGDPEIKWAFAKIWATNNGMGLARAGFDFITTAVPISPGFKGALGEVADTGFDMVAKDAINKRLDELEQDPNSQAECWGIGATEFGPVVVPDDSGDEWVRAEITEGNAISVDPNEIRKITPEQIGTATLRVRTQEEPFPGPFGFEDKPVEVLRKEVVWIPSHLIVENPGETKTIKFRVDNSRHNGPADVNITPGPNLGALPPATFSGGVHTIELPTPTGEDEYPTWIDAASTSKELPPGTPERKARMDISSKETITLSPRDKCVGAGNSETLTATVTGPGELKVSWEIVSGAGSLSSTSGEVVDYIAPNSGSGTVTIRASLDQNPDITDEITLRYGVCSGLALNYGVTAEIGFPFQPGGTCNNPDLDDEQQELFLPDEDFLKPGTTPPPSSLWINRSERFTASLGDGGVFGEKPSGQETCVTSFFNADAMYDATFTGSPDGTKLDLDIDTEAASIIKDMGEEIGEEGSSAGAFVFASARFDSDIDEASQFLLQVNLECTGEYPAGLPIPTQNITLLMLQVRPDGTLRDPNITTDPINAACDSANPILQIDRTLEFVQPDEGQKDQILIIFQAQVASYGAITNMDSTGEEVRRSGSIQGSVSIEQL